MYVLGAARVERLRADETKEADGELLDHRGYPLHDVEHYDGQVDYRERGMPSAENFLRSASRKIDFYVGFEEVRSGKSPVEQEELDEIWSSLTRDFSFYELSPEGLLRGIEGHVLERGYSADDATKTAWQTIREYSIRFIDRERKRPNK